MIQRSTIHDDCFTILTDDMTTASFRVLPSGVLQFDPPYECTLFTAYVNGNWYASNGAYRKSSKSIPSSGQHLFTTNQDILWLPIDEEYAEIANPSLPLSPKTHAYLFVSTSTHYGVIIADGKLKHVIRTELKKNMSNIRLLVLGITAMIREHDEASANEIEDFWLRPQKRKESSFDKDNE